MKKSAERFAVVIPAYNHHQRIGDVIKKAKVLGFPIFVIDDGSTDSTDDILKKIKGITLLKHNINMGKGAALLTGFTAAAECADWAITIDADGQHNPKDAENLIHALINKKEPNARQGKTQAALRPIVVGTRQDMVGPDVPWTSRFGRGFSNFWVWASGGPLISDSQSGFRMYPIPEALQWGIKARRFQFEVEILAKARWKGVPVIEAPVSVTYTPGMERISHFRPFIDFMRNSSTFCRLICQRIFIPPHIRKKIRKDA